MSLKKWYISTVVLHLLVIYIKHTNGENEKEDIPTRYQIATLDWKEVNLPLIIAIWLLVAAVAKILFHIWPQVSEMFPDSSLLIMVGLVAGIFLNLIGVDRHRFYLGSQVFFLYLLPPLVFDAGYFMPARQFFDNLGSILALAFIGTAWNFASIGISLWAIGLTGVYGTSMPFLHYMLFASLIVDVDPVAVIVIFEEMQVNVDLYIAVFGESLLNDGISVVSSSICRQFKIAELKSAVSRALILVRKTGLNVLYKMMLSFTEMTDNNQTLIAQDYIFGVLSFFVISFGGLGVGLIYAFVASYITKYTDNVKILNPVFVLVLPFCAYLTCEMFGLSSIIGAVFCGAAMRPYVQENIPAKAFSAINYFVKVLSLSAETVIFIFLGLSTVSNEHHWNSAFIVTTVTLCILYRTLGVTVICYFLNKGRLNQYSKVDQFIIAYGGLRGAIAYGLVVALPDYLPGKKMFVTCCIVVIYWTVFLQGLTVRPIASFLEVERKKVYRKKMIDYIYENLIDYTMAGMEDIAGIKGHASIRIAFEKINKRFLKPWLIKKKKRANMDHLNLIRAYENLRATEARAFLRGQPGDITGRLQFQILMEQTRRSRFPTMDTTEINMQNTVQLNSQEDEIEIDDTRIIESTNDTPILNIIPRIELGQTNGS